MNKQYEHKYGWRLMASGMALAYMLLHHSFVQASFRVPEHEPKSAAAPLMHLASSPWESTIYNRDPQPKQGWHLECLWPIEQGMNCH